MRGKGRRLVVDADVGRAAADQGRAERGQPIDERALRIALCLKAFYDAGHIAVFSPKLIAEWDRHVPRGSSGRRWLVRMLERRRVDRLREDLDAEWVEELIGENLTGGDAEVAREDKHLVSCAVEAAEYRLLSCDDKAREKYARLANDEDLARLHWVNPSWPTCKDWLLERAPDRPKWTLLEIAT